MNGNDFRSYTDEIEETARDVQQDRLSKKAEEAEDKRKEERFLWVFAVILFADFHAFPDMESWAGPVTIGVLELFLLVVLGARWGVDDLAVWVDKILGTARDVGRSRE